MECFTKKYYEHLRNLKGGMVNNLWNNCPNFLKLSLNLRAEHRVRVTKLIGFYKEQINVMAGTVLKNFEVANLGLN